MKWGIKIILSLLLLVFSATLITEAYSEEDFWILEMVVNNDYQNSQVVEGIIIEDKVFLPIVATANLLNIPLNIDYERKIISFKKLGEEALIYIDAGKQEIYIDNKPYLQKEPIYKVAGKYYLNIKDLEILMNAEFKFKELHLIVYIASEHIKVVEDESKSNFMLTQSEKEEWEDNTNFSISNIKYNLTTLYEKLTGEIEEPFFDSTTDSNADEEKEECQTELSLDMKGTLFDWRYQLGGLFLKKGHDEIESDLKKLILTYDFDRSIFQLGTLNLQNDPQLEILDSSYYGFSLASKVNPLLRASGNIIQVSGEAAKGSVVTLYLNGWKIGIQKIKDEKGYLFKDVLLNEHERANEIKIMIEKPNGLIEEIYRYVAVSEAILNRGEINYLAQLGKIKAKDSLEPYFINSLAYWGVGKDTTLGTSWYGEFNDDIGNNGFNYNSLKLNQRVDKNNLFKAAIYRVNNKDQEDLGYLFNYDYQDKNTWAGLSYEREVEQFNIKEEKRERPQEIIRIYCIEDLTLDSMLEAQYKYYQQLDDSSQFEEIYQLDYKIEKERWKGSAGFKKNIYDNSDSIKDTWCGSLAYLILPNLELINELKYQNLLKDDERKELVALGLEGLWEIDENQISLGTDWSRELDQDKDEHIYKLLWSRNWQLADNKYLQTSLGYNYNIIEEKETQRVPISVGYYYLLPNDSQLSFNYQGGWEKKADEEDMEHRLSLSLSGAFNFFDGKLTSTSPLSIGSKIGIVNGLVYNDSNFNGQFDIGEETISNIPVKLDSIIQYTDEKGKFEFKQIIAGVHKLGFAYDQLPIELTSSAFDKTIQLEANGIVSEDLGLFVVGAVDGRIMIKGPALEEMDLSLDEVKITANPGSYTAHIDAKGYYFFDQLPSGEYLITIDKKTIPEWAVWEEEEYKVKITDAGEYISNLNFNFKIKEELLGRFWEKKAEMIELVEEELPDTIEEIEDQLIDITDQVLKIDIERKTAFYKDKEIKIIPFTFIDIDKEVWAPLRAIAKVFNARVFWDHEKKEVYLVDDEKNILFNIKFGYAVFEGIKLPLKGIQLKDGHVFVTLEDLNILGLSVELDDNLIYICPTGEMVKIK